MKLLHTTLNQLLFGALLLVCLQVPIVTVQYIQYLSGYLAANQQQLTQLTALAEQGGYASVDALVDELARNSAEVIQKDAENKRALITETRQVNQDIIHLQQANYPQQLWYLVQPNRIKRLDTVLEKFAPGVPLQPIDIAWSVFFALLLSALLRILVRVVSPKRRGRRLFAVSER